MVNPSFTAFRMALLISSSEKPGLLDEHANWVRKTVIAKMAYELRFDEEIRRIHIPTSLNQKRENMCNVNVNFA